MRRALLMVLIIGSVVGPHGPSALAGPEDCSDREGGRDRCVEWSRPPGSGAPEARPASSGAVPECWWEYLGAGAYGEQRVRVCRDGSLGKVQPAPPSSPATPVAVAEGAYGQLIATLPDPEVVSSPPLDKSAIITFPTFVEVGNWSPVTATETAAGLTVTITGTPSAMTYTPGEPASAPVACPGPGVPYDPFGGPLAAQAANPAACTWPYAHRTGAEGRPEAWTASVSVTWAVTWSASSGESGSFADVVTTTSWPRDVVEVQTVVTGGELG